LDLYQRKRSRRWEPWRREGLRVNDLLLGANCRPAQLPVLQSNGNVTLHEKRNGIGKEGKVLLAKMGWEKTT